MSSLFTPYKIHDLEIPNRIIRSATWEGMADEKGFVTDKAVELYTNLAKGGTGLIITGYAYVRPEGKSLPGQLGVYRQDQVEGLSRIAKAVHDNGSLIFAQIVHGGGETNSKISGIEHQIAPSAMYYAKNDSHAREIELDEIPELVAAFADAAVRVKEAGFDGVQLHGAHGYLISRFLSPATNKREDQYGGSIENRARFGCEVIKTVRREVGDDFPISVKLNSEDFEPGGLILSDSIQAAEMFIEAGIDHLEISGGTAGSGKLGASRQRIDSSEKEAYFKKQAMVFRKQFDLPLGVVGGIRSLSVAEKLIEEGLDTVSICRPLIVEPDLPNKWKNGESETSICISDGSCFLAGLKEGGIYCKIHHKKNK